MPLPDGLTLALETDPPAAFRATLAERIHAFHAQTVRPWRADRFGLRITDAAGGLAAGLIGVTAWEWLFVEAVWVDAAQRGRGTGRALMAAAEDHARARGCHAAWLDTFQAREFYQALGYEVFGSLADYPPGQTRWFLRKTLWAADSPPRRPRLGGSDAYA